MSLDEKIDDLLRRAAASGDVPGVVAGVTTATETLYEGGHGERVAGSGVVMTADTVGWIASMTKAVTGAAAMQLVERGDLDLDRPAGETVAHLGEVEVLEGFVDLRHGELFGDGVDLMPTRKFQHGTDRCRATHRGGAEG